MPRLGFLQPAAVKDHPPSLKSCARRVNRSSFLVCAACLAFVLIVHVDLRMERASNREAIFAWALSYGAVIAPELRIDTRGGIRGFYTDERSISANTTVIAVPREILIDSATAVEAGGLACAISGFLRSDSLCDADCLHAAGMRKRKQKDTAFRELFLHKTTLAVFLMERFFGPRDASPSAELLQSTGCSAAPARGESRHDVYVESLPALGELGLLSSTLGLGESCHGVLNGTIVWQRSLNKRVSWSQQLDYFKSRGLLDAYSLGEFMHAQALIKSRAFNLALDGSFGTKQPTMVPFVDLMNMGSDPHSPPVVWNGHLSQLEVSLGRPQQYLSMQTTVEVGPHTELLTTYGAHHKSNSELMQSYGFTLDSWQSEAVPFAAILPSDVQMKGLKRDLLDTVTLGSGISINLGCDDSFADRFPLLLALGRIAVISDADLHAYPRASAAFRRVAGDSTLSTQLSDAAWRPDKEMLSAEHEARALALLVQVLESDLALKFPQAVSIEVSTTSDSMSFHRRQCAGYLGRTVRDSYGIVFKFCREASSILVAEQGKIDPGQGPSEPGPPPERSYAWSQQFDPTVSCAPLHPKLLAAWQAQWQDARP